MLARYVILALWKTAAGKLQLWAQVGRFRMILCQKCKKNLKHWGCSLVQRSRVQSPVPQKKKRKEGGGVGGDKENSAVPRIPGPHNARQALTELYPQLFLCFCFEIAAYWVAQTVLEVGIFLSQAPEYLGLEEYASTPIFFVPLVLCMLHIALPTWLPNSPWNMAHVQPRAVSLLASSSQCWEST